MLAGSADAGETTWNLESRKTKHILNDYLSARNDCQNVKKVNGGRGIAAHLKARAIPESRRSKTLLYLYFLSLGRFRGFWNDDRQNSVFAVGFKF